MTEVKAKAKEISTKKESLHTALLRQKKLEKEVLKLTNKVVSTSGVYFKHSKEHVSFLYPNLELS